MMQFSMLEFNNDVSSVGDCPHTPIYGLLGDWVSAPGDTTVRRSGLLRDQSIS
jgi:hypothetical protein